MGREMLGVIVLLACMAASPALAEGGGFTFGSPRQYTYPNEPQYQYPPDGRAQRKCPKGQAPYQGQCRVKLPVR